LVVLAAAVMVILDPETEVQELLILVAVEAVEDLEMKLDMREVQVG
jgi:hypothetical protein